MLINAGNEDPIDFYVSTMNAPEVVHYLDLGKLGVLEGVKAGPHNDRVSGLYSYENRIYA